MNLRHAKSRAGFTLMEVLAVLLLMGLVLPVLLRGASLALSASSHARRVAQATALAGERLEEIVLSGNLSAGSGRFESPWQDYEWTATVTARDYNLSEVVVVVQWQARDKAHSVRLATLASGGSAVTP